MLGFLAHLVGRLPVGRKLLLIYLLDLTAVIYVSGILIHEKFSFIDFARKEVAGNQYIATVRDTLLALPAPFAADAVAGAAPGASAGGGAAARVREAEQAFGAGMRSDDVSATYAAALEQAARSPRDAQTYATVVDAGRALITRLGNQSNLILDPDLDSYYTMSLVVLRFAELHELLEKTTRRAIERSAAVGDRHDRLGTELLILEGQLDALAKAIESDYDEAFAAGPPALKTGLAPTREALRRALADFRSSPGGQAGDRSADATGRYRSAETALAGAWREAATQLDGLVDARIDRLFSRMWLHLGTAAALLGVILSLVYFVASNIARPLRHLADVATEVSRTGDYSKRALHENTDEIGQLVTAFNRMLGELDRSRAQREELVATARAQEAQRELLESFPTPMIVTSIPEHRVLHANQPAQPWLGGVDTNPWRSALDAPARARWFQRLSDVGDVDGFEVRWKTGERVQWALLSGRRLSFQGQDALLTAFTPIDHLKRLESRLQLWAKVFEASSESIVILDVDRRILTANQAFTRTTGYDLSEVSGQTPDFLYSPQHDSAIYATLWQAAVIRGSWQGEVWLQRKSGDAFPNWLVANAVRSPDGRITHLVVACVDISEHKANEARIHHLAHHDVLTDLPNRALCIERLRLAVEQAGRNGTHVGVVFIDLDRFKNINDSLGHHAGDALLRSVAARLSQAVRAGDTVSRLGGDEFVVVLNGVASVEEIDEIVSGRMVPLVRQPHRVDGAKLHVSCSAGIAVFPQDGRDIDHLMRNADAAMYQAKSAGRDSALFFTPEFHAQAQERLAIENRLRDAVSRGEMALHMQPRIDGRSGRLVGVEALARWTTADRGAIPPGRFIPIAEETGQIIPLGAWILGEACRHHAAWKAAGLGAIPVSVNVSAVQLRDAGLVPVIEAALREHGVEPSALELELTETFLMDNAIVTTEILQRIKEIGVTLSIDDFGTGYSSLHYLHQFPIDKLKVDQSFVRDMLDDPADLAITRAIIGLGHTLGLRVVAEGVEHPDEEALLQQAGCDELQGFLYAEPMDPARLAGWLDDWRSGGRMGRVGRAAAGAAARSATPRLAALNEA